jgi:succinate-acetate transporter protein
LSFFLISPDYILIDKAYAAWNVFIVIFAMIGTALYMCGYLMQKATDETRSDVITLGIFLILWGVFTHFVAVFSLSQTIFSATVVEVRALTLWDYISYWTWELKGIIGICIGLLVIITLLIEKVRATYTA